MGYQAVDSASKNSRWILCVSHIDQSACITYFRRPFEELEILFKPYPYFGPQVSPADQKSARVSLSGLAGTHGSADASDDVHARIAPSDGPVLHKNSRLNPSRVYQLCIEGAIGEMVIYFILIE